ncbi:trigger factor [bacterium]|nr:trigger factor [bacterium]
MKLEITDQEGLKKRLGFEIPQDIVTKEIAKVYNQLSSTARLKGFRPGRVPPNIFKKVFWPQIKSGVIKNLLPEYYRQAIDEAGLEPIGDPKLGDFSLEEGKPLFVTVDLDVKPAIEPSDYTGIDVEWQKVQATDEDVAETLARLQENNAQFEVVEDRAVKAEDAVVLDCKGTLKTGSKDMMEKRNILFYIKGGDGIDDFTNALIGMNKGETKRIDAVLPEGFPDKDSGGEKAILDVTIKEIKEKSLPSLDDEFARDIGEFGNLAELKEGIKGQIQSSLERQAENLARERIIKALLEKNPFEPPDIMVESRIDEMIAEIEDQLRSGDSGFDADKWDRIRIRDKLRPQGKRDVHLSLILEGIAKKEGLSASEDEIERELGRLTYKAGHDFEEIKNRAKENGTWGIIRNSILIDKAMKFVLEKANRIEIHEVSKGDTK